MSNEPDPPPRRFEPADRRHADRRPAEHLSAAEHLPAAEHCDIALQNPCRYSETGAKRWRSWIRTVVAELSPQAETFAVRFVSDREMSRLNSAYRGKDGSTDVLSFPGAVSSSRGDGAEPFITEDPAHLGDVAISVPRARSQARERGHSVDRELRTLLLHGVLHCLGHDHETDDGAMERLEMRLRSRFIDTASPPQVEAVRQ